ncbi:hypothetical protein F4778DRAFT_700839 [Xylariomycetidae sp. FL2044]|nr:hypothetical protein F4778DRAFT_700839 [Xylariomycetidae sp. FL2044]
MRLAFPRASNLSLSVFSIYLSAGSQRYYDYDPATAFGVVRLDSSCSIHHPPTHLINICPRVTDRSQPTSPSHAPSLILVLGALGTGVQCTGYIQSPPVKRLGSAHSPHSHPCTAT